MHSQFEMTRQQFQRRLYAYAYYSLRIAEDAEEIVQEAFVKLWEHWHEIEPRQVGAWLMRVTQNLVVDHVRRQRCRPQPAGTDPDELVQDNNPEQGVEQRSLQGIVEESIAALNDPYRTILIMREIQGLSYQDIATILCVSCDHVKTNLFRAKRKLREAVRQHPRYHHDLLTD